MVIQTYKPELQSVIKATASEIETLFLDLHLSISNSFVSYKINDKRDDFFNFIVVKYPFLDGMYISQLIRLYGVCSHVTDLNAQNKCLTAKLFAQDNRYRKLRKMFSKFHRRLFELISKLNVSSQP